MAGSGPRLSFLARPEERSTMPAVDFTCCSECGRKLHTTFFCQDCGQPSCSLDCYCRHEAGHSETQQETQSEDSSARLEPVR